MTCTCDENCDSPCTEHWRENELQNMWLIAREALLAIVKYEPPMPEFPAALKEPCPVCDLRRERGWPPSGLCDKHFRILDDHIQHEQRAKAMQHYDMRRIAEDALKKVEKYSDDELKRRLVNLGKDMALSERHIDRKLCEGCPDFPNCDPYMCEKPGI